MKNIEVVEAFVNQDRECKSVNLKYKEDKLIFFYTTIAQRHNGKLIYNDTKYSVSTSKIQHYIRVALANINHTVVTDVQMGASDLYKYIEDVE